MKHVLLVFIGGGLGSALRYLIGKQLTSTDGIQFPWGTFTVNLFGSLIIGSVLGYLAVKHKLSNDFILFAVAGFCGGFTTFSAFAHESFQFLKNGHTNLFFYYVAASIIFGLVCVWLGYFATSKVL